MAWLWSKGEKLYYEVFEPKQYDEKKNRTIIFAHGAAGNSAIWFNQTAYFSKDYRCIVFDHHGFARSSGSSDTMTIPRFRDDLIRLMDHLKINRAHLVGQSMGGYTVLRCSLDAPKRVLSLTLSGSTGGIVSKKWLELRKNQNDEGNLSPNWLRAGWSFASIDNPVLINLFEAISNFNVNVDKAKLLTNLQDVKHAVTSNHLRNFAIPTLMINGVEDTIFPVEILGTFVSFFQNAEIKVIENCAHSPFCETPDEFNRFIRYHFEQNS